MIITAEFLESKNTCGRQIDLFRAMFGESVDITPELCRAMADKFDWDWAAEFLLNAPAWAEYKRLNAPAWAEYERLNALTWVEYERLNAPAWAEYERLNALAWADAWNAQGGMGEEAELVALPFELA